MWYKKGLKHTQATFNLEESLKFTQQKSYTHYSSRVQTKPLKHTVNQKHTNKQYTKRFERSCKRTGEPTVLAGIKVNININKIKNNNYNTSPQPCPSLSWGKGVDTRGGISKCKVANLGSFQTQTELGFH